MDLGLRDRVAIVTGASKGIGRQVAADLGAEGCHVVVCGRDEAALRAFEGWKVRTVPRAQNAHADALVNAALDGAPVSAAG